MGVSLGVANKTNGLCEIVEMFLVADMWYATVRN
jgi:hypothetical protein